MTLITGQLRVMCNVNFETELRVSTVCTVFSVKNELGLENIRAWSIDISELFIVNLSHYDISLMPYTKFF